jgi:hypothetical protein
MKPLVIIRSRPGGPPTKVFKNQPGVKKTTVPKAIVKNKRATPKNKRATPKSGGGMKRALVSSSSSSSKTKHKTTTQKSGGGKENILRLRQHPNNARIRQQTLGKHQCAFVVSSASNDERHTTYTGLTKRLKAVLYPNTQEDPSRHGNNKFRATNQQAGGGVVCLAHGKLHGKLVHEQLNYYVRQFKQRPGLSLAAALPKADPCTRQVVALCAQRGWEFIESEFMFFMSRARVATAADLLVYDSARDHLILLELKTGYESELYGPAPVYPKFRHPLFQTITNCPKNRHLLQLMAMREILKRDYKVSVQESYILRVTPRDAASPVELVEPASWCDNWRNRQNLVSLLVQSK